MRIQCQKHSQQQQQLQSVLFCQTQRSATHKITGRFCTYQRTQGIFAIRGGHTVPGTIDRFARHDAPSVTRGTRWCSTRRCARWTIIDHILTRYRVTIDSTSCSATFGRIARAARYTAVGRLTPRHAHCITRGSVTRPCTLGQHRGPLNVEFGQGQ